MQPGPRINGSSLKSSHNRRTSQRWGKIPVQTLFFMAEQHCQGQLGSCSTWGRAAKDQDLGKLESFRITFAGGWPMPSSARGGAVSQRAVSVTLSSHELMVYRRKAPGGTAVPG